jgi:hypothetical protein
MCTPAQKGCIRARADGIAAMNENRATREGVLTALHQATEYWQRHGNTQPLTRWLSRELDPRGAPIRLPIPDWHLCVETLLEITALNNNWPSSWDDPITKLIQITFRFSRVDGTPVTHFDESTRSKAPVGTSFDVLGGSKIARIASDFASRYAKNPSGSRNEPSDARSGSIRALAVLRPGWPDGSDFLAIDHRHADASCRLELFAAGRSWLGPTWMVVGESGATSHSKRPSLMPDSSESLAEWSYRAGQARITHSALLLRESKLALLSALIERRSPGDSNIVLSLSLPSPVTATPIVDSRSIVLTTPKKPGSAQVLPIGLPSLSYPSDRGSFQVHDGSLALSHSPTGRRTWLPLLVSWDSRRHRTDPRWRVLSVSEKSRNVPPDRAFAARVSWGRNETFVIYRSLASPAPRAFLGHQTSARFLVARFTLDGVVEPILKVD